VWRWSNRYNTRKAICTCQVVLDFVEQLGHLVPVRRLPVSPGTGTETEAGLFGSLACHELEEPGAGPTHESGGRVDRVVDSGDPW
jgi:hypothetical protein